MNSYKDVFRKRKAHGKTPKPIEIKPSKEGSLHKALGIPKDEKIPVADLKKAEKSKSPALRKKAVFADNSRKFKH